MHCPHDVGERDAASYDDCPICLKKELRLAREQLREEGACQETEDILRQQIADLTRDKERLNWLDSEQALNEAQDSNYQWQSWGVTAEADAKVTVREAIDAARRGE